MKSLKSFADSKKVKYGTLNIIFISIVIAIVIMVNSIFTVLSSAKNWYIDMTKEQLYTISDPLVELLTEVSQDVEIDIIFCQELGDGAHGAHFVFYKNRYLIYGHCYCLPFGL